MVRMQAHKWHSEGKHWNVEHSTGKQLLDHNDVATMIYIHVLNSPGVSVKSPLDG